MAGSLPRFKDGDVEIRLSDNNDDTFVLHSYVLALHSPWFKASLSDRWNPQNVTATGTAPQRWVYELRFDEDTAFGLLSKRVSADGSKPESTEIYGPLSRIASEGRKELHAKRFGYVHAHRELLQSLYYTVPSFDDDSLAASIQGMRLLSEAAGAYGADHVIRGHIERRIKRARSQVFRLDSQQLGKIFELAMALKSESIFTQASNAAIGSVNATFLQCLPKLNELKIAELINGKRAKRIEQFRSAERHMFMLQAEPLGDVWALLAVDVFRQWLVEELIAGKGSTMGPNYCSLYCGLLNISKRWAPSRTKDFFRKQVRDRRSDFNFEDVLSAIYKLAERAMKVVNATLGDEDVDKWYVDFRHHKCMEVKWDQEELPWSQ